MFAFELSENFTFFLTILKNNKDIQGIFWRNTIPQYYVKLCVKTLEELIFLVTCKMTITQLGKFTLRHEVCHNHSS